MAGAIVGKTQRQDVWKDSVEVPATWKFLPSIGWGHSMEWVAESTNAMQGRFVMVYIIRNHEL